VRKVRQIEVAYNYTFLGENLGYSEQKTETEIRDQASQRAKIARLGMLGHSGCFMYMKGMEISAKTGLGRAVAGAE